MSTTDLKLEECGRVAKARPDWTADSPPVRRHVPLLCA